MAVAGAQGELSSQLALADPGRLRTPEEAAQAQEEAPAVWEVLARVDRAEYALLDLPAGLAPPRWEESSASAG
jgi:hypothetical protein